MNKHNKKKLPTIASPFFSGEKQEKQVWVKRRNTVKV
jgi:hypothetical protein